MLEAFVWDASPPPSADEGAAGEPGVAFNATSLRPAGEWYSWGPREAPPAPLRRFIEIIRHLYVTCDD